MLRMQNLSKIYRTHMIETHALRGFDIHVREGEFVAVTGPSGSGKTTFLNIAGLLEEFTGGDYLLDGVSVRGMDDNARSRLRNEKIGFIFQGFNLIPDLNLFDNVDVPLRYRSIRGHDSWSRSEDLVFVSGHVNLLLGTPPGSKVSVGSSSPDPALVVVMATHGYPGHHGRGSVIGGLQEARMNIFGRITSVAGRRAGTGSGLLVTVTTHPDPVPPRASTRKLRFRPSILVNSAVAVTLMPTGVAATVAAISTGWWP